LTKLAVCVKIPDVDVENLYAWPVNKRDTSPTSGKLFQGQAGKRRSSMYYLDPLLAKVFLDPQGPQLADRLGYPVPTRSQFQQAGSEPSNWLSRSSRRTVARLGARLVLLGERLEQYGPPQHKPDPMDGWHSGHKRTSLHQEV
jgi:hypothetical protein